MKLKGILSMNLTSCSLIYSVIKQVSLISDFNILVLFIKKNILSL